MTTIRSRLLWTIVPALAVLLAAGGGVIYLAIRDALQESTDAMLRSKALAIAWVARMDGMRLQFDPASRVLRDFEAPESNGAVADRHEEGEHEDGDSFFEIWRDDGAIIARSPSLQ